MTKTEGKISEQTRQRIIVALQDNEVKHRMSIAAKIHWNNPEIRERIIEARYRVNASKK